MQHFTYIIQLSCCHGEVGTLHRASEQFVSLVCSDMLAWVHQSLASERELLVALFGGQEAAAAPGSGGAPSDMPSLPALLDRVFESICKPLKVCRTSTTCHIQPHDASRTLHVAASCGLACKRPPAQRGNKEISCSPACQEQMTSAAECK